MSGGARRRSPGPDHGIWSPFRSLLLAQVLSAVLGLVFWVLVARMVGAREIGIAAAAISAQTLLGIVTVLGFSTMLISELPQHGPARQRRIVLRSLLVVGVASLVAGVVLVAVSPLVSSNLRSALGDPLGAGTFVVGTAACAWALVVDDACLAVKRPSVQVLRNLVASSLRFPVTAGLLLLGFTDAHVLQVCWVLPLVVSVPIALRRLRLPRDDEARPALARDVRHFLGLALPNHGLSLSLAAGSQMVPVVAGLTLASVDNAAFAIAWLMATFVFLPPYLLSTALFAHAANVSTEEFRATMARTIPAALALSALLCVGAWGLGEPVLLIFGGEYSTESWGILALLVPAGLWMVFKDHLVALWRSQRRFGLATRLTGAALLIEVVGAMTGGILGGAHGLSVGWLVAMGVEMMLGMPWLREALGGLDWQLPFSRRSDPGSHVESEVRVPAHAALSGRGGRGQRGQVAPQVIGVVALVFVVGGVGLWTATRGSQPENPQPAQDAAGLPEVGSTLETCDPTADRPGPEIDLNVQSATGFPQHPILSKDRVSDLVGLAKDAGAEVISTTTSFRTMQPTAGEPLRFGYLDRTVDAARAAGLQVRLQVVGMPEWALDDPQFTRQPPRSEAELAQWVGFVTKVLQHLDGKVDYLEVWNEPNDYKWWPTGPDAVEFARLMDDTYRAVRATSPTTQVISGGLASNDIGYLSQVYAAFKKLGLTTSPLDMVGAHPFAGAAAPDDIDPAKRYNRDPNGLYDENFSGFTGLHKVMADHGDDDLPIYITQFGYSTKALKIRAAVPDPVRATYLTQALEQATCVPYVPAFSWYALHPTPWDPADYALLDKQDQPNDTYAALAAWGQKVAAARAGG